MRIRLLVGLAVILPCSPAAAQWTGEASAGGTSHPQVADAGSLSAQLELRYQGPRWGYLAGGVPLDSASVPWLVGGLGQRVERYAGPFDFGADVSLQGHAYQSPQLDETGAGVTAELIPFVGRSFGTTRVEVGSGARFYSNSFAGETESRTVLDSSLRATALALSGLLIGGHLRYVQSSEGGFPFAGVGIETALGPAIASAHAGRWFGDLSDASYGANATLPIGTRAAISARFDREAPDPLFWNAVRDSWGLGVRYDLGRRQSEYRAAPVQPSGMIELRVPTAENPGPVFLAGDFTSWEPVPMELVGNDWTLSIQLDPGIYHYAFQRADGSWFLPQSVTSRVDDGFGGENAILIVGGTSVG